nr:DUF5103 domain-containing protein [Saprospiraceae bacterium]
MSIVKKCLCLCLTVVVLLLSLPAEGQHAEVYEDGVFKDYIRTVVFHPSTDQLAMPAIRLGSSQQLVLRFDDMEADVKRYFFSIVHCDADWRPSELEKYEYIDGFDMEEIFDYQFSRGTLIDYTHYNLRLPNRNFKPTVSGNYILQVFDPELKDPLVLTRRFVVFEPKLSVAGEIIRPTNLSQSRTHQEISFYISQKNYPMSNPMDDLRACILQNGWWLNAICHVSPRYTSGEIINFEHRGRLVFEAGRNFRPMDIRTTRFRSERVHTIEHFQDGTEIVMKTDDKRTHKSYSLIHDFNGRFIIENREFDNPHLTSDYVFPFLTLRSPLPVYDQEVYVIGGFSGMDLREDCKMDFDDEKGLYYKELFLKQGYYDYQYANSHKGSDSFSTDEIEGSVFETYNDYYILLYYRPFGGRFDRVIGFGKLSNKE